MSPTTIERPWGHRAEPGGFEHFSDCGKELVRKCVQGFAVPGLGAAGRQIAEQGRRGTLCLGSRDGNDKNQFVGPV
jgi:hypothetical protein